MKYKDFTDELGRTTLMIAASALNAQVVLETLSQIGAVDNDGRTALMYACRCETNSESERQNQIEVAQLLVSEFVVKDYGD